MAHDRLLFTSHVELQFQPDPAVALLWWRGGSFPVDWHRLPVRLPPPGPEDGGHPAPGRSHGHQPTARHCTSQLRSLLSAQTTGDSRNRLITLKIIPVLAHNNSSTIRLALISSDTQSPHRHLREGGACLKSFCISKNSQSHTFYHLGGLGVLINIIYCTGYDNKMSH